MKRNLFRIFLVTVTVVSVAMMGAALSVFLVSPDIVSEMNTPAMRNYSFEKTGGETPKWTVTQRFGEKRSVGSFETPYIALIKAHQDLKQSLDTQAAPMVEEKSRLDAATAEVIALQQLDEQAIAILAAQLGGIPEGQPGGPAPGVIQELENQLLKLSEQSQALAVKAREIRDETGARRTDVLRLRHELEEVRTDLFRLSVIRRDLTDRLVRLQIENQELMERQAQVSAASGDGNN